MIYLHYLVIPGKAGTQGKRLSWATPCSGQGQALGPRLRGGDGIGEVQ